MLKNISQIDMHCILLDKVSIGYTVTAKKAYAFVLISQWDGGCIMSNKSFKLKVLGLD